MEEYNIKPLILTANGEVKLESIPELITSQVNSINAIDVKIEDARNRGYEAKSLADAASKKDINVLGWGTTKAVEALQEATVAQANALGDITDAQKVMFQGLQDMSKATSALFYLAVSNRAMTAAVIEALKAKLKNLPNLNSTAKEEIHKIIHQLQSQEEIYQLIDKVERNLGKKEESIQSISQSLGLIKEESTHSFSQIRQELDNLKNTVASIEFVNRKLCEIKCTIDGINDKVNSTIQNLEEKFDEEVKTLRASLNSMEDIQSKAKKEKIFLWIVSFAAIVLGILGIIL